MTGEMMEGERDGERRSLGSTPSSGRLVAFSSALEDRSFVLGRSLIAKPCYKGTTGKQRTTQTNTKVLEELM